MWSIRGIHCIIGVPASRSCLDPGTRLENSTWKLHFGVWLRYDCAPHVLPSFHRLVVKTFGTLSNGQAGELPLSTLSYSPPAGTSSGAAVNAGWLDVENPGTIALTAAPVPNPDNLTAAAALTAVAEPDTYTFGWSPQLSQDDTHILAPHTPS